MGPEPGHICRTEHKVSGFRSEGSDTGNRSVIHLSKDLLGVDGEKMAELASVMAHEGTHVAGNRIEALAHIQGAITYDAILKEYKLSGDKSFADAIMAGYNDAENWKEEHGEFILLSI